MREYVALVNEVYNFQTPYEMLISNRYPASSFTIYNVHALVRISSPTSSRLGSMVF